MLPHRSKKLLKLLVLLYVLCVLLFIIEVLLIVCFPWNTHLSWERQILPVYILVLSTEVADRQWQLKMVDAACNCVVHQTNKLLPEISKASIINCSVLCTLIKAIIIWYVMYDFKSLCIPVSQIKDFYTTT